MSDGTFFPGQLSANDATCPENAHDFAIRMALARVRTAGVVTVKAVHAGAQPDQWTVDVQLVVSMQDGAGNTFPHGIIQNRPVHNFSGANGSFCVQPAVNDIGLLIVWDRDHSSALKNKGLAAPGSRRIFDLADSEYLGGFGEMNSNTQRIVMSSSGINVNAPNGFNVDGNTAITGSCAVTGAITATGNITAGYGTADQVDLLNHTHGGVSSGGSQTLAPTAGT